MGYLLTFSLGAFVASLIPFLIKVWSARSRRDDFETRFRLITGGAQHIEDIKFFRRASEIKIEKLDPREIETLIAALTKEGNNVDDRAAPKETTREEEPKTSSKPAEPS